MRIGAGRQILRVDSCQQSGNALFQAFAAKHGRPGTASPRRVHRCVQGVLTAVNNVCPALPPAFRETVKGKDVRHVQS